METIQELFVLLCFQNQLLGKGWNELQILSERMCTRCNACLNSLVSYCEKFICDGEACKFWTLQGPNPKGDPEVVWWCHCPSQFFVSQHAACLMLGWLCFWPWSLAWAIVGALRMYDLGQFLVHLTDADTNSTGGCAIISVSPDNFFFFLSCSGFFLLCPAFFLIHHLPFPIFISPFWPWRLQSLALTTLWHMSLIAVEGKSWVDENGHGAGQGGWTQGPPSAQGTGLKTWSEGHHSHGCHWRWVVYIPPILLLCSALCPDLRWNKSWNQSPGIRVLGGWESLCEMQGWCGPCVPPTYPPSRMSRWRARAQLCPRQEDKGLGTVTCWALRLLPE